MVNDKKIIGITGAEGLLAYHARCYFYASGNYDFLLANRDTFSSETALSDFVENCDIIFHFAGVNRGSDLEITDGNVIPAKKLSSALSFTGAKPHIFFSSSIRTLTDGSSSYASSKKEASSILREWAATHNARFTNLILPHLYGEFGRPYYNSAIATFCHQLAISEQPQILTDMEISPMHCQSVMEKISELISTPEEEVLLNGKPTTVSAVLKLLTAFHQQYREGDFPELPDRDSVYLFNTLRSYMFPKHYPVVASVHSDPRGNFFEAVRSRGGGQTSISTTEAGAVRGNHFHFRKIERFCVIKGKAIIRLRRLFTDAIHEFTVDGSNPVFVDIPTYYTHNIINNGDDTLLTLFWTNELFNPEDSDTFVETV